MKLTVNIRTNPPYYMHREDRDVFGRLRTCAPCPAVFTLLDDPHAAMSRQWQYFLRAINYAMTIENVYLILDDHLAFANDTGFPTLDNPGECADFFFNRNILGKAPSLNKVRTCSRNTLTGVKRGDMLEVWTFNSKLPPPLKPGRRYPSDISQVNPDDYLYMPQTDPEKFMVANMVNTREEVVQFPRGALYPWTGDNTPYTFIPHISNYDYGPVLYPLENLIQVAAPVRPYRSL